MLILGIDPGYTNLGLAVIDSENMEIVFGETITVGVEARPDLFAQRLWPRLERIFDIYPVEAVATETPPYLTPGGKRGGGRSKATLVKTSALLARVSGIIQAWAEFRGVSYKEIPPVTLKRHCARILKCEERNPSKTQIAEAVESLFGKRAGNNHANDAALIAHLYSHAYAVT